MSAASLIAIATGLSTGTTLIAFAALAAIATTLALMRSVGSSLVGTSALGTGLSLLTSGTGAFFASAAFRIGSTVASRITTTAVLTSALLLLSTFAIGLIAALGSFLTALASGLSASTKSINILLNTGKEHLANAFRRKGCTSNTVNLSLGLASTFLHYGEGYLAIFTHNGATNELALEGLILNESTQTGGLTLMVEVSAEYLLKVGSDCYITPQTAPKATALKRKYEGISAVGGLCLVDGILVANLLRLNLECIFAFEGLAVGSEDASLLDQFVVLSFYLALIDSTNIEGSQDLFLLVDSYIGILSRLKSAADEGQ